MQNHHPSKGGYIPPGAPCRLSVWCHFLHHCNGNHAAVHQWLLVEERFARAVNVNDMTDVPSPTPTKLFKFRSLDIILRPMILIAFKWLHLPHHSFLVLFKKSQQIKTNVFFCRRFFFRHFRETIWGKTLTAVAKGTCLQHHLPWTLQRVKAWH